MQCQHRLHIFCTCYCNIAMVHDSPGLYSTADFAHSCQNDGTTGTGKGEVEERSNSIEQEEEKNLSSFVWNCFG